MMSQLNQHFNSLIQFCLKGRLIARNLHIFHLCLNGLFGQIESVGKEQTCPAAFNALEHANNNYILCPRVCALVGLSGMIEEVRTTEDLSACFGVDEIIQCNQ